MRGVIEVVREAVNLEVDGDIAELSHVTNDSTVVGINKVD